MESVSLRNLLDETFIICWYWNQEKGSKILSVRLNFVCIISVSGKDINKKKIWHRLFFKNFSFSPFFTDELKSSLSFEKKRYQMLQQNSTNKEQVKVLEEQIRDLQVRMSYLTSCSFLNFCKCFILLPKILCSCG